MSLDIFSDISQTEKAMKEAKAEAAALAKKMIAKAEDEGIAVLSSEKTNYELSGLLWAQGLPAEAPEE